MSDAVSLGHNLDEWRRTRWPRSHWRVRARKAIQDVLEVIAIMKPELLGERNEVLERVDAAYPFGERAMEPYKCWLKERRLFIAALEGPRALPSEDEAGVCAVAGDLVELGRIDEARKLLDEQAPNRLARKCPACLVEPGRPCREFEYDDPPVDGYGQYPTGAAQLIVPHHARLIGHRDAGPLFGRREFA